MSAKTNDAIDLGSTEKVSEKRLTVSLRHHLSTLLFRSALYTSSKFHVSPSLCIYFRCIGIFIRIDCSCSEVTATQSSETICS